MDQLRSLRVFAQVIIDGSFAAAARTLDLAPAVVTRAVSDLEEHLGARLVNRTTRSLALTAIGEVYLERAKRVIADLEEADAMAGAARGEPSGGLRVVCPPAFATHQLARYLPEFCKRYPRIQLELAAPGPLTAADENFDVSILSIGQQPMQGDFVVRPLVTSTFIICAAPAYLKRNGRPEQPTDLLLHDALLPAVAAVRRELTLVRQVPDRHPAGPMLITLAVKAPVLSTGQLDVIFSAAVAGMGVAGLPSFMVAQALQDGRLERVLPEWCGSALTLYVAMPTSKHVPAKTRVFIDFLVETFGGTPNDPWLDGLPPAKSAQKP